MNEIDNLARDAGTYADQHPEETNKAKRDVEGTIGQNVGHQGMADEAVNEGAKMLEGQGTTHRPHGNKGL